jgi:hypothetical protein
MRISVPMRNTWISPRRILLRIEPGEHPQRAASVSTVNGGAGIVFIALPFPSSAVRFGSTWSRLGPRFHAATLAKLKPGIPNARSPVVNGHREAACLAPTEVHHLAVIDLRPYAIARSRRARPGAVVAHAASAIGDHLVGQDTVARLAEIAREWVVRQARGFPAERLCG